MVSSIQVEDSTLEMLKGMKSKAKARSYNQIILRLMGERHRDKSLFGFLPKGEILKDLRDEKDRA